MRVLAAIGFGIAAYCLEGAHAQGSELTVPIVSLNWLKQTEGFEFEAEQSSQCLSISTKQSDSKSSITRKLKGVVARDGRYRYEIINTGGPDVGVNWIIAFDGKVTSIYESSNGINNAFIKRGPTLEDPFLARANVVFMPFMFLKEKSFLPGDMGTYVSIEDILAASAVGWWAGLTSSDESEKTRDIFRKITSEDGHKYELVVSFNLENYLPTKVIFSTPSGNEKQIQEFVWEAWEVGLLLPVISTTKLFSVYQGLECDLVSKLLKFELLKLLDDQMFKIDLSKVDHVYDRDKSVIIPLKK